MRPNLLVFFTDQQRWDTCGCYGNPMGLTPHLDEMANRGVRFTHSFTVQPVCGPARACLQTGSYATWNGCFRNGIPLPPGSPTIAKACGAAGWWTGYIGKWHLGVSDHRGQEFDPEGRMPTGNRGGYKDLWLAADVLEFTSLPNRYRVYDGDGHEVTRPGYRVDAQTDLVLETFDALSRRRDRPFLLFVSYLEPHMQNHNDEFAAPKGWAKELAKDLWVPPDLAKLGADINRYLPGYYGCVKSLDANLGRVLGLLRKTGLDNNTVVLFCSDHGNHFRTRNDEYKRSCHEASIRVPTVMQGPGFDGRGKVDGLVDLLDWHATLMDAAGLTPLPGQQGRPLQKLLEGKAAGWNDVFVQVSESQVGRAIRTRRWKYGVTAPAADGEKDPAADEYEDQYLYDLEHDPHELENLSGDAAHSAVRDELAELLKQRMVTAGEKPPIIRPGGTTGGR